MLPSLVFLQRFADGDKVEETMMVSFKWEMVLLLNHITTTLDTGELQGMEVNQMLSSLLKITMDTTKDMVDNNLMLLLLTITMATVVHHQLLLLITITEEVMVVKPTKSLSTITQDMAVNPPKSL